MVNNFFILTVILFFSGCGEIFTGYSDSLAKYEDIYSKNDCDNSFVDKKIKEKNNLILWNELGGSLQRDCKNYLKSNNFFDRAEELYKNNVDLESDLNKAVKIGISLFSNDNSLEYKGNTYEKIMLNVYKGLNFMSLGDFDNARVEFNRALDRQRIAKDDFAYQIKKEEQNLSKNENLIKNENLEISKFVKNYYENDIFKNFVSYPDFINPFATYISALFFYASGDISKSRYLFKESLVMQPENQVLQNDYSLINEISFKQLNKKHIWLIYENGQAPIFDEFKLNLPLILLDQKIPNLNFSFPELVFKNTSFDFLYLNEIKTDIVSDMDRVIQTEFNTKLDYIILRSILRTGLKMINESIVREKMGDLAGLGIFAFNFFTNNSDIRSWISLPKNFQVARIDNKNIPIIIKDDNENILFKLNIPEDKNAIIYLKSLNKKNIIKHEILF